MHGSLFEYIRDSVGDFLHLLQKQLEQEQLAVKELFQRWDALQLFHAHVAILEQSMQEQDSQPSALFREKFQSEIDLFIDLIQRHKSYGLSVSLSLQYFWAIDSALQQLVLSLTSNDSVKNQLLNRLNNQVRMINLVLMNAYERTLKDQTQQNLEAANLQLIREKSTYKNIFEGTSNLVFIADGEGRIAEVNPEARLFFSRGELIGSFCGDLLEIPENDLAHLLQKYPFNQLHEIVLLRGGQNPHYFNLEIKPLEKSLELNQGVMLILSDVTCMIDHRQALEERIRERTESLENSEKMLNALFQSVGKGVLLIDRNLEIVKANQQASVIYGLPLQVLVGTQLCSLISSGSCDLLEEICSRIIEGGQEKAEITSLYVDGESFPCEIVISRMELNGEHFWPVIIRDISQQCAMEDGLRREKQLSEEMNVTLKNVLRSIETDRKNEEQQLTQRMRSSILPGLEKVRKEEDAGVRGGYLNLIREQLVALTIGFEVELDEDLLKLSKSELKTCYYIKAGLSSKEICKAMNLSFETIQTHRKNIRKKLGLSGKSINLHTFLSNKNCDLGLLDKG